MRREARGDDVDRGARDRERRRVRLDEPGVRDPRSGEDGLSGFEHLARRVDADRRTELRRDPAERVPDARADVQDPIAAVLGREGDDAIEIRTLGVRRALDVRGGGAAELPLHRLDVAHVSPSRLLYSIVGSRS